MSNDSIFKPKAPTPKVVIEKLVRLPGGENTEWLPIKPVMTEAQARVFLLTHVTGYRRQMK